MNEQNQIDQYILGQLSPEASEAFRKRLLTDEDLAVTVKKRQIIMAGFEALGNQKMKTHIQSVRKDMLDSKLTELPKEKSDYHKFFRLFWIAAASILLIFAGQYFFNKTDTPEQLFQQAYQAPPLFLSSREMLEDDQLTQAESYYNSKKFALALPLLKQALVENPEESYLKLAIGNAYLGTEQTQEAIAHFESIIQRQDPLYIDQARWFLALSFLKQGQISKARDLLTILAIDAKADFHEAAEILLKKL